MGIPNERMKALRSQSDKTLREMAERIGVSEATVQRYESGKISKIPYKAIVEYAKCFNVTPKYLMGWEDEPSDALIELASKYSEPITIPIEIDNPNIAGINRNLERIDLYKKALSYIYRLNTEGLDNLINYADLLLHDDKYVKKEE